MMDYNCLRCGHKMEYLKEYRFDSQDNNRGLFSALFDVEEHLIFEVHVCPQCRHSELFYKGSLRGFDR